VKNPRQIQPVFYAGMMYFGYYLALGAYAPFINLYFERIGLRGVQIGSLAALAVAVFSATALAWGFAADRFRIHRQLLIAALLLTPLAVLLIPAVQGFPALALVIFFYGLFGSAIVPLLDSHTLEIARKYNSDFGRMRVWGSVSWSISTLLTGALIQRADIRFLFYFFAIVMGMLFLVSFFQPERAAQEKSSDGRNFRELFRLDILVFLVSVFLLYTSSGAVLTFFSIYMDRIGAAESLIGLSWAVSALSEIPVLIFAVAILRRIGSAGLLRVAFVFYALRWLALAYITQPYLAVSVSLMHGLSFGAFLIGGVNYMNERAPKGLGTTAQALFSTATFGLGSITGSLVGGYLIDLAGIRTFFLVMSGFAAAGFILFSLGSRFGRRDASSLPAP
jgi:MFS transporter, PPP family, 3-phenylpropionic acid transporter